MGYKSRNEGKRIYIWDEVTIYGEHVGKLIGNTL